MLKATSAARASVEVSSGQKHASALASFLRHVEQHQEEFKWTIRRLRKSSSPGCQSDTESSDEENEHEAHEGPEVHESKVCPLLQGKGSPVAKARAVFL